MSVKTPIRSDSYNSNKNDLKRSPTTPLTPSIISQNNIIRRKLNNSNELDFKNSIKDSSNNTSPNTLNTTSNNTSNNILHDILINNWTMNKELKRVNSLLTFTEIENSFK
ncbi:hypothetical protein B5S28_g1042 [[Candida] boidinii]|nr:hypothetical protein B5S28_g1042 [[Candida] boidinii]OWB61615.1 hypothetical protein B5S29_g2512 [[Candida] boidinii]OWB73737.1 hypothetical protein B5S31_g3496 [[Candida] boidinii]GME87704.1 unnamed protein product [[Candida] boidinii]